MNERIKLFAELAKNAIPAHLGSRVPIEFTEKFAQLIVKECGVALSPMLRDMISRGQAYDLIKQHFEMNPNEITTAMLDRTINQCEQQLAEKKND
jgi:hypothetical protein